jgi:hypothetical protein
VEAPVPTIDAGGDLTFPRVADGRRHLDKTLIGLPRRPHGGTGTRVRRIENEW